MCYHHCTYICVCVCSKGEMVELSSNFIRYSTFRSGKEQLVSITNITAKSIAHSTIFIIVDGKQLL